MKKIHFLLLISLLLAACSDDDKEKQPAFVTNITISDAGKTFNPGDAVTVKADGLQSGDQIILDIYWPIADNPLFPEGYSRYTRAVTTEQTTNSITFLAPGHWPASRVEMFLERAGQLQPLRPDFGSRRTNPPKNHISTVSPTPTPFTHRPFPAASPVSTW